MVTKVARVACSIAVVLAACGSERAPARREAAPVTALALVVPDAGVDARQKAARLKRIYPSEALDAKVGDTVLVVRKAAPAPVREVERAALPIAQLIDDEAVTFAAAKVTAVGESTSTVTGADGVQREVPNAAAIPWPRAAKAKDGDLVLMFAYAPADGVVLGRVEGRGAVPLVNPMFRPPSDLYALKMPAGTYRALEGAFSTGTSVAVRRADGTHVPRVVLRVDGELVLAVQPGARLAIEDREACTPIPVHVDVQVGQRIWAPIGAGHAFVEAEVLAVQEHFGTIAVGLPGVAYDARAGKPPFTVARSMFLARAP